MPVSVLKVSGRSLIVAPRMPAPPRDRHGNPFTLDGDIVVDCDVPGCGWHALGPRVQMGLAVKEHHRQHHASAGHPLVAKLNTPRL